jgi:HD-GYP domain-containing protein (c-di-GMP phosphodiesterase class II)
MSAPGWAALGVAVWFGLLMLTVTLLHAARRGDSQAVRLARVSRVQALVDALRIRDEPTGRHSGRVAELVGAVARDVGMAETALTELVEAAALHDLGKLRVPDAILHKPAALTPAEWAVIRRHPDWGAEVVAHMSEISHLADVVRCHHEHYDGGGYPSGLAGAAIPLGARIVAVCDAYDAMVHDRPHRPALPAPRALAELRANAGHQFDPEIVAALERTLASGGLAGRQESLVG